MKDLLIHFYFEKDLTNMRRIFINGNFKDQTQAFGKLCEMGMIDIVKLLLEWTDESLRMPMAINGFIYGFTNQPIIPIAKFIWDSTAPELRSNYINEKFIEGFEYATLNNIKWLWPELDKKQKISIIEKSFTKSFSKACFHGVHELAIWLFKNTPTFEQKTKMIEITINDSIIDNNIEKSKSVATIYFLYKCGNNDQKKFIIDNIKEKGIYKWFLKILELEHRLSIDCSGIISKFYGYDIWTLSEAIKNSISIYTFTKTDIFPNDVKALILDHVDKVAADSYRDFCLKQPNTTKSL
ncbi:MAG: hypothetical protein J0G32_00165 [Alphaproteobacteria bacterium]|nr:hypothetical protein [Alphaproteobacteria bacterium]OJV12123.1 MAG: hypothetical protein BGO27_05225 [Alphaproteobacteria bacterium 33-17]